MLETEDPLHLNSTVSAGGSLDKRGDAAGMDDFAAVLRRVLIHEKRGSINGIAGALGLAPRTFYARLHNQSRFAPNEVAILLREVRDPRLAEWLFARSALVVVNRTADVDSANAADFMQQALTCATASSDILLALIEEMETPSRESSVTLKAKVRQAQSAVLSIKLSFGSERPVSHQPSETDFAALVRQVLLVEHNASIRDIAARMGMGYSVVYDRMMGRVPFSPLVLRKLFEAYPESRIAEYLLTDTPYTVIGIPCGKHPDQDHSPLRAGLLALQQVLQIVDILRKADNPAAVDQVALSRCRDGALGYLAMLNWTMSYIGRYQPSSLPQSMVAGSASPDNRKGAAAKSERHFTSRSGQQRARLAVA